MNSILKSPKNFPYESITRSWRNRLDHTDSLSGSLFHNCWRARVFTIKGKRAGFDQNWSKFVNFKNDMLPSYEEGFCLTRIDKTKPFSKNNCIWKPRDELSEYRLSKLEYDGKIKTLKQWCLDFDLNYNGARQRYFKGKNYSPHEILFGKKRLPKRFLIDQANLNKNALRSKASKMISSYKCKDKKRRFIEECDITIEWMIENILKKKCSYCDTSLNVGVDRLDNEKPHIKKNSIPCCAGCNAIRGNRFTFDEMRKIGQFIKNSIISKQN